MNRIAVVLFNLGGPDRPGDVVPFLRNLFADRAIIDLPAAARLPLAAVIAALRGRRARTNYGVMGGGSPLLAGTQAQARRSGGGARRAPAGRHSQDIHRHALLARPTPLRRRGRWPGLRPG